MFQEINFLGKYVGNYSDCMFMFLYVGEQKLIKGVMCFCFGVIVNWGKYIYQLLYKKNFVVR